jgi:hypothetical protein
MEPVNLVNQNTGGISPLPETTVPLVNLPNSMMRVCRMAVTTGGIGNNEVKKGLKK